MSHINQAQQKAKLVLSLMSAPPKTNRLWNFIYLTAENML